MLSAWHVAIAVALISGCGADPKRTYGQICDDDSQCETGTCYAGLCIDPDGDEDADGLINRIEVALGTNLLNADSDNDGIPDAEEVGVDLANPADSDGDGRLDALESNAYDSDFDCIADQFDPDDTVPETDPAVLATFICSKVGACAVSNAGITARCDNGSVTCDYAAVPRYEANETSCDAIDNDCDGLTDERYLAKGEVTFDGGPYAADAGKVLGASCGVGACTGGAVVCAADSASLTCSTAGLVAPLACNSDKDCNGIADAGEVANPIATPLAGCSDFYSDADRDGHGAGSGRCLCSPYGDYQVSNRDDCAEADPARYPMAPAICGVDADCDLRLEDMGEACDDGNSAVEDGCNACQAVARRIDARGLYQYAAAVTGLTSGGFVVAWDAGSEPTTQARFGRSLAFFDTLGKELKRYDGIGLDSRDYASETHLVALPDGRVAVGAWRLDLADGSWVYEVQRYDQAGEAIGKPASVRRGTHVSDMLRLVNVGRDALACLTLDYASGLLVITSIDADSNVRSLSEAGLGGSVGLLDAVGMDDGSLVASWTDFSGDAHVTLTQRFDADGKRVGEPRRFEVVDTEFSIVRLVRRDNGWALFFLANRYIDERSSYPVGYQVFEGDAPLGALVYLQQDDSEGCPYELAAGFDAAGYAWAAVTDGECQSPSRGWYAGATTVRLAPLDHTLHPDGNPYAIVGAPSGQGFVLAFMVDSDARLPGVYVMRYGAGATPLYLP